MKPFFHTLIVSLQVRHVSRLLAAQLTNAGLGPGVQEEKRRRRQAADKGEDMSAQPAMEEFEKVSLSLIAFRK